MKNLLLVINPRAGQRRVNRFLTDIVGLFNERGWRTEVYVTGATGDGRRYIEEGKTAWDMIVCAGGDGTLNETIAGAMASGLSCPLGYIPCGTTNDYASSIGLSTDVMQAARDIVDGAPRTFDVGAFNGRGFVYTATCGAFARASYSTPQAAKNVLGHLAYVLEGMKDLTTIKPIRMRVEANGKALEDDFLFCSVTNSTSVGGILKLDSTLVALNDGRFEVTLVRNPVNAQQLSTILLGLTTMELPNEMIYFFSADRIRVRTEPAVEWTLDGERADEVGDVTLENLHNAVRIVLPQKGMETIFQPEEEAPEA